MARKKRIRSRLAKLESQRMMRQSILLFTATIGIILLLVFWGIPALIRVFGIWGDINSSDDPIAQGDTIAPFAPQLSIPFEATSSARINVDGFAEPGSTVLLFNNGKEVNSQVVPDEGAFTFSGVALEQGINDLTARAIDPSGNESSLSRSYEVEIDSTAPEVSIDSPSDGAEFFSFNQKVVEVTGVSEPEVEVTVNGRFTRVDEEGNYSQKITLSEGENEIVVVATDRGGNTAEAKVKVNYKD